MLNNKQKLELALQRKLKNLSDTDFAKKENARILGKYKNGEITYAEALTNAQNVHEVGHICEDTIKKVQSIVDKFFDEHKEELLHDLCK